MSAGPVGVYGASGWIGRAVVAAIRDRAIGLRALARQPGHGVVEVPERPEIDELVERFDGLRAILLVAGRAHVPEDDIPESVYANVTLPARVVEAAASAGVRRVVLLSSIKAAGEGGPTAMSDCADPRPASTYGQSKRAGEQGALTAGGSTTSVTVVRPPLVAGRNAPGNFGRLVELVRKRLPIPLPAPYARRSIIVRSNLVDLLIHLAMSDTEVAPVIHAAEPLPMTTAELVRSIGDALDVRPLVVPFPAPVAAGALRLLRRDEEFGRLTRDLVVVPSSGAMTGGWVPPMRTHEALRAELRPTTE